MAAYRGRSTWSLDGKIEFSSKTADAFGCGVAALASFPIRLALATVLPFFVARAGFSGTLDEAHRFNVVLSSRGPRLLAMWIPSERPFPKAPRSNVPDNLLDCACANSHLVRGDPRSTRRARVARTRRCRLTSGWSGRER